MITPEIFVAGIDVSAYVVSLRIEGSTDQSDPDKIDLVLANTRNRFTGMFKTDDAMAGKVYNQMKRCTNEETLEIQLFDGQVQKVTYGIPLLKIEGSCGLGTLSDQIKNGPKSYPLGTKPSEIVNDLLDTHGGFDKRVIEVPMDDPIEENESFPLESDYLSALSKMASKTGSYYYSGEDGTFYFVDPKERKGSIDLTDFLVVPEMTFSIIKHANVVNVLGATVFQPGEEGQEMLTHLLIHHIEVNDESIAEHGELIAPTIIIPGANEEECDRAAKTMIEYYKSQENVATPMIVGRAPPRGSYVSFTMKPATISSNCGRSSSMSEGESTLVEGLVTRSIIELSSRGLYSEIDVSTGIPAGGLNYPTYEDPFESLATPEAQGEALRAMSDEDVEKLAEA